MVGSQSAQAMRSVRNLLLVLALGGVAIALPVLADQSSDYPAPCDASKVTKGDVERAHTVFLSGKQFLEESNYDKAISYFKDAYSIDCSVHGMLPIIATAYERKGDKGEAVRALEEYLKRAPSAADHDVIERRIRNLKDQVARDQAAASASALATAATSAPLPVPPAPVPVESPAPATSTPPSASPPPPAAAHGAAPWIVAGIGGAAALVGVVVFAAGASDISSAEKQCPSRTCPLSGAGALTQAQATAALDEGNKGRGLENAGGALIGSGLAVVAAGILWHFLEKPADNGPSASAAVAPVSPVVGFGYAGVSLAGSF